MAKVDPGSFLTIVLVGAIAAVIVSALPKRYAPPVVVLEIAFGIIVGPQVLGLAHVDAFVTFFSNLGLGMLFFFAGYEIDFDRIRGKALMLAGWGWVMSIALAYGIGAALAAAGIVLSFLYTGSALATTAIGTLIPILRDEDELRTPSGPSCSLRARSASLGRSCCSRSCSRPRTRSTARCRWSCSSCSRSSSR